MKPKLLIATRNPDKQREIRELMADSPYEVVFPEEQGVWERPEEANIESAGSFEGNAHRKAQYFARLSSLPTVGEDSGIEVFALGGLPGVKSRRFALPTNDPADQDQANNDELLRRLAGAPESRRRARYRCLVVFLENADALPVSFEGTCNGHILERRHGTAGFGYDPLFFSADLGKSFGEATQEEKDGVSHRGRAFQQFKAWLVKRERC